MTSPMRTADWLAIQFRDRANESPEENTEQDAAQVEELQTAMHNVAKYDAELNRLEIAPNGDDYNALMSLLTGGEYTAPHVTGR